MSSTPRVGEALDQDSVKLLEKGDVISHPKWGVSTYMPDEVKRPPGLVGPWAFIGRPDADGWITWSGGENPVPGQRFEVRTRDGEIVPMEDGNWVHDPRAGTLDDIIAFRVVTAADTSSTGMKDEVLNEPRNPSSEPDVAGVRERLADAWAAECSVRAMAEGLGDVFSKWADADLLARFNDQIEAVMRQCFLEGAARARQGGHEHG